jgi:hypothetical protein
VVIDIASTYPAVPDAVLALLTDEQFLRDRAAALRAQVQEVSVTGAEVTVRLAAPTAGIPPGPVGAGPSKEVDARFIRYSTIARPYLAAHN